MPSFFEGLFLVFIIFNVCIALAIVIKVCILWFEQHKSADKTPPAQESKIYLVKQTLAPKPKPKAKRKRSPKIAFEGLVLKPEKVMFSQEETPTLNEREQKIINF